MIQNPFANMTPVIKNLLMINVVFFIARYALGHAGLFDMDRWLSAYYVASPDFRMWQIVSYMFMHANFLHILFNMFALVSFGPFIEQALGEKRFLIYYLLCGVGALVCQEIVQALELHGLIGAYSIGAAGNISLTPQQMLKIQAIYQTGLVGASGAVFGVLIAFAMLFPNLELMVIPIPVPVKAKFIVPIYIVIELVLGVGQFAGDSVAHFAHLGGALIGFIVIKLWGVQRPDNFY